MFAGIEDNGAGGREGSDKGQPHAPPEIISHGRIQFDEDGELVGFEEMLWRRDASGGGETRLSPLTPTKADDAGELDEPGAAAAAVASVGAEGLAHNLVGSLDTFEKHRPRDWLGFMVTVAEEERHVAEEAYRQQNAPVLEAARVAWMKWLDTRAESLYDDLRTPRLGAPRAHDSPVLLEPHSWRHSEEVRELVRGGVPHELRARIWPLLCGSSEAARREATARDPFGWAAVKVRLAEVKGSYTQLHELRDGTVHQIAKDVPRTFSRNDIFKQVR